ncbi:zf-HC2 domain-containing protein [bacterium]|nr:zf-HC2 domain-containing protein [candidate division CSSED10-310 bacterium]
MNCKQILKHIDDYQSGSLDHILKEMIDKHLESCSECRKVMEKQRSVTRFLKTADVMLPTASVVDDVLKKLDAIDRQETADSRPETNRLKETRTKWLMIIAVLLGIGLISMLVIPFDSNMDQHNIGRFSGPGYTWLGDMPLEDPMETRWYDPELSGAGNRSHPSAFAGTPVEEIDSPGRVTHVLEFDSTMEPSTGEGKVHP